MITNITSFICINNVLVTSIYITRVFKLMADNGFYVSRNM
jgi:hypothetical protein